MKTDIVFFMVMMGLLFVSCSQKKEKRISSKETESTSYVQISLSVTDLKISLPFYEKLGFRRIGGRDSGKAPWAMLSDGKVAIMLSQNPFPSPALTFYETNLNQRIKAMRQAGLNPADISRKEGTIQHVVLRDPNGLGVTYIQFDTKKLPQISGESHALPGEFTEISLSANNPEKTVKFWQQLGFEVVRNGNADDPQVTLTNKLITIGVYQTQEFSSAALTYSATDISAVLQKLQAAGIHYSVPEKKPTKLSVKVILRSPDGQLIYVR